MRDSGFRWSVVGLRFNRWHACGQCTPVHAPTLVAAAAILILAVAAGCGGEEVRDAPVPRDGEETPVRYDYTVYLQGAVTDTLRGEAGFGIVVDTESGMRRFVIVLQDVYDPFGGLFLVRGRAAPPDPGTYRLATHPPDSAAVYEGFGLVYRRGMQRRLVATSGTLTLTTVRDTLVAGSFEATLRGSLVYEDERLSDARLSVRGTFRADARHTGFLLGL